QQLQQKQARERELQQQREREQREREQRELEQQAQAQAQELLRTQAQQRQQQQQRELETFQLLQQQLAAAQSAAQNVNLAAGFPPTLISLHNQANLYAYGYVQVPLSSNANGPVTTAGKYQQLLAVIEEMGKDIRQIYSGSKTNVERFKRLIIQ